MCHAEGSAHPTTKHNRCCTKETNNREAVTEKCELDGCVGFFGGGFLLEERCVRIVLKSLRVGVHA